MKKMIWMPAAVLMVLLPGLAAVNLFAFGFPAWVMWIPIVLLVAANVLYVTKSDAKLWARIALPAASALMIAAGLLGSFCNPYWNSISMRSAGGTQDYETVLTYEQAEDDMEQMLSYVRKTHPAFMDGVPEEFAAAYDRALGRLAQDSEITVNDLYRELQRTMSVLGDGHTNSWPVYAEPRYPKIIAGRKADGWEFCGVNGMTVEQIFEENRDLFCFETDSWGIEMLLQHVNSDWGLDFLGYDTDGVEMMWTNEAGESQTDVLTDADFLTMAEYQEYNAQYAEKPESADGYELYQSFVYYTIFEEEDLALLTLKECRMNEEYRLCLQEFFSDVKEQGISNIAVDLRGNGGGNSLVANEFIRYLDTDSYMVDGSKLRLGVFTLDFSGDAYTKKKNEKYTDLTFDGDVYLLTDTGSFSSAMLFAAYIKDNDLGTLIGEPPGNEPNSYGDIATFRLDNSGLHMSVSTKQFFRPDRECTDELVMPDIECESDDVMNVLMETIAA